MREWNLHSVCEEAHCPNIGECWEERDRDLHDPGRRVHPRTAATARWRTAGPSGRTARSPSGWAAPSPSSGSSTSSSRRSTATIWPTAAPAHFAADDRGDPARGAGLPRGGADPGLPGHRRPPLETVHRAPARRPQSQHRDGAAAVQGGAPRRAATTRTPRAVPAGPRARAGARHQVGDHAGPGRGARRGAAPRWRPPGRRRPTPDARPVPPAVRRSTSRWCATTARRSSRSSPPTAARSGFGHVEAGPLVRSLLSREAPGRGGGRAGAGGLMEYVPILMVFAMPRSVAGALLAHSPR